MRFGINLPPFAAPAELVELAVLADANGWDGVFVWDHLHFLREVQLPVHDPWVLLGAIAHATERARIGPMITPLARRRPAVVAKHVTTLDHLSGGRAVLGVGLGFPAADDFEMFGEPGDARVRAARLDEALEVVTALWSGGPVLHDGPHHRIDAQLRPAPVQRPRPPIWVATMRPRVAGVRRRAQRYDGVLPLHLEGAPLTPAELREHLDQLGALRPGTDVVAAWGEASVEEYAAAGATWLIESRFPDRRWVEELRALAAAPPGR